MRAHLLIENKRGEILVDEDVNDLQVSNMITWWSWEKREDAPSRMDRELLASGAVDPKPQGAGLLNECQVSMSDLARVEITPCRDRLILQDERSIS